MVVLVPVAGPLGVLDQPPAGGGDRFRVARFALQQQQIAAPAFARAERYRADAVEIIEQGKHAELLERKGFYYDLYTSQFKNESE